MESFLGRFVISDDPAACREWTGRKSDEGYGQVYWQGKARQAHVVAWELRHGPVPKGLCVCHSCDNPPCCNWDHLFLGTHADNMADMAAKGRQASGERVAGAKLQESDIPVIRALASTLSRREIARRYGVCRDTIAKVVVGKTWRHVA